MMKILVGGVFAALALVVASQGLAQHAATLAPAIQTTLVPCPTAAALVDVPEITPAPGSHRLRATIRVVDGPRTFRSSSTRCASIPMRYFTGHAGTALATDEPRFSTGEILPGPTLRAHIGDWVEIAFYNHVNPLDFPYTLDRGDHGDMSHHGMPGPSASPDPFAGCDVTYQGGLPKGSAPPSSRLIYHPPDKFPNCLHGSSTTNLHFHGTHTTPSTTGDNVLLFVRPANRLGNAFDPPDDKVAAAFATFFAQCEKNGYPAVWHDMPESWRNAQTHAINWYDHNAPYNGNPRALPTPMWLEPVNTREVAHGLWPQYQIGATPYCFPLPRNLLGAKRHFHMEQAPGTHWYHAHKHGSTALNVANGMTGAFIIEGPYDEALRGYYGANPAWKAAYRDRVLVIQQLTPTLNLTVPGGGPGSRAIPLLSVNGRYSPVVTLRRNQVELFRFVNGAERDGAYFAYFRPKGGTSCSQPSAECVHWKQTAQDGVQLAPENYNGPADAPFYLAPANRADLLMQAPNTAGTYELVVKTGLCRPYATPAPATSPSPGPPAPPNCVKAPRDEVLLVVNVPNDNPVSPKMEFVPVASFPKLPGFLDDIPASEVYQRRSLVFEDNNGLRINGKQFSDSKINQTMQLNAVEEWTVSNLDGGQFGKEHPFHIHINPFQIVEVFKPNDPETFNEYLADGKTKNPCWVDPLNPKTWRQCHRPEKHFVWWDTFAIPISRSATVPCAPGVTPCQPPPSLKGKNVDCSANTSCTVTIPGYFKMRTRFVDFTGQYVLHCHILTHEDRGMMELIQVVPDTTIYTHH